MSIDFTIQEKIELIIDFYGSYGYIAETIDEFPLAKRFVTAGYAELNENNIYEKNKLGADFLHETIMQISMELVTTMKNNGWSMPLDEMLPWYISTYQLTDCETGSLIKDYILKNIDVYGYRIYPSNRKNKYILEKYNKQSISIGEVL